MPGTRPDVASPARDAMPWETLLAARTRSVPMRAASSLGRVPLPGDAIDLASQQPSPDLLPHEPLRRCLDDVLRDGPRALAYAPAEGVAELRSSISRELGSRGIPASAEDVVVTNGSQQGIDLLARALVDPGDAFLVEESTYPGAIRLLAAAGARTVAVPCDDEGPDLQALRGDAARRAKGFYLMPNHGNPTARSISRARRAALVAWSRERGVPLVEDDYDADLALDGAAPPPSLRALDAGVCHLGTYSKKLIPALRIGYLVCPEPLRTYLVALKADQDNGGSALLQHALALFLDRGHALDHVDAVVREYRARRDALETALRAALPARIAWERPTRGLFLWIPLPDGPPPAEVHDEARRRGVQVIPSLVFDAPGRSSPGIRVAYCREPRARLEEGARRLGAAIRHLESTRR